MSKCRRFQERIADLAAGDLSPSEWEEFSAHGSVCEECRRALGVHTDLLRAAEAIPEPRDAEYRSMRMRALARIGDEARIRTHPSLGNRIPLLLRRSAAATGVAAIAAVALFLGRWSVAPPSGWNERAVLRDLERVPASPFAGDGYWDTPYTLSNVSTDVGEDGRLRLGFDVSRRVDVVTERESALAREVLLQAILAPSTMGSRVEAMSLSSEIRDDRIKRALIVTLRDDPELAVRMKALSVLTEYPYDREVEDALLETLRRDDSVNMRLEALEKLAERRVTPETLMRTIEEGRLETDPTVLLRAVRLTGATESW